MTKVNLKLLHNFGVFRIKAALLWNLYVCSCLLLVFGMLCKYIVLSTWVYKGNRFIIVAIWVFIALHMGVCGLFYTCYMGVYYSLYRSMWILLYLPCGCLLLSIWEYLGFVIPAMWVCSTFGWTSYSQWSLESWKHMMCIDKTNDDNCNAIKTYKAIKTGWVSSTILPY